MLHLRGGRCRVVVFEKKFHSKQLYLHKNILFVYKNTKIIFVHLLETNKYINTQSSTNGCIPDL